jgi:hypothetical protein
MADPGEDSGGIALDFHPAAPAVTLLPSPQLVVHKFLRDLDPSREAGQKGDQSLAVRLPRGEKFQHLLGLYPMECSPGRGQTRNSGFHLRLGYAYFAVSRRV